MDAGLHDASAQQPRGQWIGDSCSARHKSNQQKTPKKREVLEAVRMCSGKPPHEGGDVGIVGLELVGLSAAGDNEMAAQNLHDDEQEQRPSDEQREHEG